MKSLRWSEPDGSIPHAILHADGRAFDAYTIYDRIGLLFDKDADLMRSCMKATAKTYEVEFPNGDRRPYKTLATAKRAIERHFAR
jgi:hypothetical protein